ncbi:hypothetical protein D5086_018797 [Populus alba]|uniref:Uncharacterized protein n=3 Tax=Populus TaxID=3689 RepID=A0ACC4BQS0_POPAL|nr:hypothetical protein D5086_0000314390 [Populus alba]
MASTKPLAKVEDHVDIDPKMEWEKNDGFDTLLVHLPDYDLNQVRARFEGGVLYIKHPKKITIPTKPVQENNADPSVEPQKPANEKPEDQNSGQDPAAQEVPPKTEVEGQTRGDIDGKTNATSTEANLKDQKSDYILPEEGKATGTSEKNETDGGGGLIAKKKKLRISTAVVVSAGLFVLVLGLYVQKAMRSHGEYES